MRNNITYLSYFESKNYIKNIGIKTQREYSKWIKGNSISLKIPSGPRKLYKKEWNGWGDFLGTNSVALISKEFYSYEECSNFVISKGIKSKREYQKIRKSISDSKLPSNPDKTYEEWSSWESFFGNEKLKKLSYIESKEFLKNKKISNNKDYIKYIKENNIEFLLLYPSKYDGFEGYDVYLNRKYVSYLDAKKLLLGEKLKTRKEYIRWINDNDINTLPKIPHKYYKEFVSYDDYLTNDVKYSKFIEYELAIEYIKSFNIKTQRDYKEWQKINNIEFLPNWPDGVYDNWESWNKFLNTSGHGSTGESIINRFLIENNISFIRQKKFDGCRRKLNLSFDFYLPEHNTCIEYNGEQHYKSIEIFGGLEKLEYQQKNDYIKKKYCEDNNIKLIIIPYTFMKNINTILLQFINKNNIKNGFL